jgi:hypothetical protein
MRSYWHMHRHRVGVRTARVLALLPLLSFGIFFSAPAPVAVADVVSANDMLLQHNQLRSAVGAPTILADPRVVQAAQSHASYSAANRVGGHFETAGLPYYTGYAPRDRVAAAGLSTAFVSEVATGSGSALNGVRQLWDAPYHRLGLMHPNASTAGWGHSDLAGSATVADIVYDFSLRPSEFVRSPANGQTGIPTSWSGNESPSPLPAGVSGPVGYPIMVVYSAAPPVDMRAAELVAPDGSKLPIYYAPQQYERDYQVIIPQRPLAAGTTYHVRFDINVGNRMVTNEWDFTTAGVGNPAPAPALTFHSSWLDQSTFPTLGAGQSAQLTVHFRNTGTATWQKGVVGAQANLGINGDDPTFSALGMNVGWLAPDRPAPQSESSVAPGGTGTFTFMIRAPASPGTYRIPVRPVIDGRTWMEDQGVFLLVTSSSGYHSRWAAQSAYPALQRGAVSGPLTIQFTNAGSRPWVLGALGQQANLGVVGDDGSWSALGVGWLSANRVAAQVEMSVVPGAVGSFTFQVRAPSTPGVYRIAVRPVIDGTTWMEDDGVFLIITVV